MAICIVCWLVQRARSRTRLICERSDEKEHKTFVAVSEKSHNIFRIWVRGGGKLYRISRCQALQIYYPVKSIVCIDFLYEFAKQNNWRLAQRPPLPPTDTAWVAAFYLRCTFLRNLRTKTSAKAETLRYALWGALSILTERWQGRIKRNFMSIFSPKNL